MAVDVQDVGAVLPGARGEDHVGQADPVLATGRELALSVPGRSDRLRVDAEISDSASVSCCSAKSVGETVL